MGCPRCFQRLNDGEKKAWEDGVGIVHNTCYRVPVTAISVQRWRSQQRNRKRVRK